MEGELLLKTGELAIGEGQDVLCTRGVGSCIVTCLWDRKRVLGGMAHIPRPAASEEDAATPEWSAVSPDERKGCQEGPHLCQDRRGREYVPRAGLLFHV